MMRQAGARDGAIRDALPAVFRRAQASYERTCPPLARAVCPGVRQTLVRLRRAGVLLGLVTGNLTGIAWTKTGQAGLAKFFRFGAFSDMGQSRAHLVRLARGRAVREGWISRESPVSLIGDHANDVIAARLNHIRSIAVATGLMSARELSFLGPDYLLQDLRQFKLEMVL
jgi:phosphoglycolate phosphatase-like HAD superfamily hydrolase